MAGLKVSTRQLQKETTEGHRIEAEKEENQSNQVATSFLPFHGDDTGSPVSIFHDKQASPVSGEGSLKQSKDPAYNQILSPRGLASAIHYGRSTTRGQFVTGRMHTL